MSKGFVKLDAMDVTLRLLAPGESTDSAAGETEQVVPEGKVGLLITGPGADVVVIGTPTQLRQRVYEGFTLPVPAGVSLIDEEA